MRKRIYEGRAKGNNSAPLSIPEVPAAKLNRAPQLRDSPAFYFAAEATIWLSIHS